MKKVRKIVLTPNVLRRYVDSARRNLFAVGGTVLEDAITFGWDSIHGQVPPHQGGCYKEQITERLLKIKGNYTVMVNVYHRGGDLESEVIDIERPVSVAIDKIATIHLDKFWKESDPTTRLSCAYLIVPRSVDLSASVLSLLTELMEVKGAWDEDNVAACIDEASKRKALPLTEFDKLDEMRPIFKKLHNAIAKCEVL